jgi:hypothetical protein
MTHDMNMSSLQYFSVPHRIWLDPLRSTQIKNYYCALKKEAWLIVEKQYTLVNADGEDGWAAGIALKVRGLLDDAGPSNMDFTDGPSDCNVNQIFLPQNKI